MYAHMKARHTVTFSLTDFHARFLPDKRFNRLFSEWVKSGYKKQLKPSLDRINKTKPYTIQNTQMMTWGENRFKQNMERRSRKGAVIQLRDGVEIARYRSQREAVKQTGLSQGLISEVLNGKRSHTRGYQFRYVAEVRNNTTDNPDLLKEAAWPAPLSPNGILLARLLKTTTSSAVDTISWYPSACLSAQNSQPDNNQRHFCGGPLCEIYDSVAGTPHIPIDGQPDNRLYKS